MASTRPNFAIGGAMMVVFVSVSTLCVVLLSTPALGNPLPDRADGSSRVPSHVGDSNNHTHVEERSFGDDNSTAAFSSDVHQGEVFEPVDDDEQDEEEQHEVSKRQAGSGPGVDAANLFDGAFDDGERADESADPAGDEGHVESDQEDPANLDDPFLQSENPANERPEDIAIDGEDSSADGDAI